MNRWYVLAVGLSCSFLPAFAGCGSAPVKDTKAPVTIDGWCSAVTSRLCDRTAKACHGGATEFANSCKDTGIANCNAGRDPNTPSGRTSGELEQCLAKLEPLSCQELQGMAGNAELVAACSAGGGSSSNTAPPATVDPAPPSPAP